MADSFAGTSFSALLNGTIADDQQTDTHVHHIPGGNNNVLDIGGKQARIISFTLQFSSLSDVATFRALQDTTGTLVCAFGTIDNATLTGFQFSSLFYNSTGLAKINYTCTWTIP